MAETSHILGIDVGSVAVSFVELDRSGEVKRSGYAPHGGQVLATVAALIERGVALPTRRIAAISTTPATVRRSLTFDSTLAGIAAARYLHPDLRSLLTIGGERFSLVRLDAQGEFVDTRTNTSCAAGTGSFLDQQAAVLGIADSATLAERALGAQGRPPRIASRCAVFARTDLIHAQQEGYGLDEICLGLCQGLANTVADALLDGDPIPTPVVFAGGVSRNKAVRRHLEGRLGHALVTDDYGAVYGALGAARLLNERLQRGAALELNSPAEILARIDTDRAYEYPPLPLEQGGEQGGERGGERATATQESRVFRPRIVVEAGPIEVDAFEEPGGGDVYLGIDVGSTSTKAVLMSPAGTALAGFYTRTAGRPLSATQGIFEAVLDWSHAAGVTLNVIGVGTTGSGRKLVGAVTGADLIVDEISAHARAACAIDPRTDTILEIGGQDAKFTTLRNGMVTSAVLNTVCAAGTGSFIEEQARRLSVPLADIEATVAGARAPLASSRCTVFMQRDISHLLSRGYSVGEVLATVLHSVRENYLEKVAREGSIGKRICFQGATAKNRALVAAFEQRLGRPIFVSKYCHLTGALGICHLLAEAGVERTGFRGLELYTESIPVGNEICELCPNHCKIVSAEVRGEVAAYGFLCGRDYDVPRRTRKSGRGFDLARARRRAARPVRAREPRYEVTIGLPAALGVFEDLDFWRHFFGRLGVPVVTSEGFEGVLDSGRRLARAEFCAPISAWHGHVAHLLDRADYVFAPVYLEDPAPENGGRRQYCYYSQYAVPLAGELPGADSGRRLIRPLITSGAESFTVPIRLFRALMPVLGEALSLARVAAAFREAVVARRERRVRLASILERETGDQRDISVVLLGRTYVCLDPGLNKGIPDILAGLGVKTFFQDMVPCRSEDRERLSHLLTELHWKYAAEILTRAVAVARTPGLYPVLLTSFKCAPDSMTLDFFQRILDAEGKPYLVLELDEHDSSVGYETRIEAAVRSFRNHHEIRPAPPTTSLPLDSHLDRSLTDRTLFLPNWDPLSCTLLAANLRREGIDAELLPETERTIRKSLRRNTGQCIPVHAIFEAFVDTVTERGLDPRRSALWVPDSKISCNLGMYPAYLKAMLEARGGGFERAAVYQGEISSLEVSVRAAVNTFFAYMFGGMLRRMACRVRPYELRVGETDAALAAGLADLESTFENGLDKRSAARKVVDRFAEIRTRRRDRPKVAIFGDLYVRDNAVISQDLVRFIERHGGEVITTPYSEYAKIVAPAHFRRWLQEGRLFNLAVNASLLATVQQLERQYAEEFGRVLGPPRRPRSKETPGELLGRFGVTTRHSGESMDNLLKVFSILSDHPDLSLFVQASPAFCCPSLVTEAMAVRIRELTGVAVVCITYDGTATPKNDVLIPHLARAAYPRPADAACS